eukprot:2856235-Amphidinium_carterae.1
MKDQTVTTSEVAIAAITLRLCTQRWRQKLGVSHDQRRQHLKLQLGCADKSTSLFRVRSSLLAAGSSLTLVKWVSCKPKGREPPRM